MTVELAQAPQRPFTVDEYNLMIDAGILKEDDRVELIDGRIVSMSPIGSRHIGCVNRLTAMLVRGSGEEVVPSVQNPIRIDEYSEPQPDVVLLRPRDDFYSDSLADPADVLLLVEVADSSEDYDRDVKLPLYAQAGIPELWIVCLRENLVLVHRDPVGGAYGEVREAKRGETIGIRCLPNLAVAVDDILG